MTLYYLSLEAIAQNCRVNTELEKVNESLHFNKLSLNYSKTSYMIASRKNNQLTDFNVKINDKPIT